ncbi:DNA polymerase I [Sphingomonas sp. SM33]|uniref:DNA polymerase I n=1 Tax=Sphingomonas telluris TaxID=2907998 RepID=A0ABS9VPK1_9SPHN|nr:DNA polymerase I [Sphingomonas telluris]MCH8616906.1 DNA polymerase I [Sphingomonas telluris]
MSEIETAEAPATEKTVTNHLYLVDGSSYIFRAYHRLPPLTNRHGMNVGAVYGYTAMLWKLADGLKQAEGPTHMAVILDASEHTHRNEMYDQYKAHRPPPPEDLVPQFPLIRVATRAFSIPCIEKAGLEADDIIACYVMAAKKAGWKVTIVSSDKDLMQLVEDGAVDMLDTMNDRRIDEAAVHDKFGVGPEKVGEVLALMGDSVDNVPGVPGVGPKTATQLIQDYGSVEGVLAAVEEIKKPKLKQNLIEHAEAARLSRELVRLVCDAPLPEPLDELILKGIPPEPLKEFLEDQGFKTLLNRMVGGGPTNTGATVRNDVMAALDRRPASKITEPDAPEKIEVDVSKYETVTDEAALDRWIAEARAQGYVAVDTETDCIDCIIAKLAGISLATGPNRACYIPVGHVGGDLLSETPNQLPLQLVLDRLKPLLEDPAVLKIGHNLKYDWVMFDKAGIDVAPYDDTMLMSFDLDAGRSFGHNLTDLAKSQFEHECISFKSLCGTGARQITFDKVPLKEATEYAGEDADIALRLWHRFKPRMTTENAERVYKRVDQPLIPVIGRMERRGVKVDRDYLAGLSKTFSEEISKLEERIYEAACGPFTIGSPQQLGDVLYGRLGLKGGRKGKSGHYSTDVNELERLASEGVNCARLVLDWRQLTKLRSTYTEALQSVINPETGRVHTSFSLTGAQTGRLSSNDPNLQNIPIRTELGRKIRDAFVAEPGYVLMSADYSQIELRIAAHMADVPQLKEAFREGADIHNITAEELFGSADRENRNKAKTVNFAILYGVSPWGLASRMGVPKEEGQAIIARYFERFPGIRQYIDDTLQFVRSHGYTKTLFGRKTHFYPNIKSPNPSIRGGAERAAINAPIQGTSADLIKRAMTRMDGALAEAGLDGVRMLLQVHDELVFEVPDGREQEAAEVVRRVMATAAEPAIKLDVPLDVEVGWGEHWGAAH